MESNPRQRARSATRATAPMRPKVVKEVKTTSQPRSTATRRSNAQSATQPIRAAAAASGAAESDMAPKSVGRARQRSRSLSEASAVTDAAQEALAETAIAQEAAGVSVEVAAPEPEPEQKPKRRRATTRAAAAEASAGVAETTAAFSATSDSTTGEPTSDVTVSQARRRGGISPENTVFVSLCFEGPDVYSTAGGLGTRVAEFTESLAQQGYETHLIFVGDPNKPAVEHLVNGKLHLKRWSQWISKYYPNGVYDGEEPKLYDYNESVPQHVYQEIAAPAIAEGKIVVIIGEDWHTAEAVSRTSDLLHWHNLRHRCILMWNCNSIMSLHRINWGRLNYTSTITTVSRYMKHRLWQYNVNPLVIPNGIPSRYLELVDHALSNELRSIMQRGNPDRFFLFKIGRFDPDKRWLMAVEAAARLKYSGHPISMVIRGGIEPHGGEVLTRARMLGLTVKDIEAKRPTVEECLTLMREAGEADIYNLKFFVPAEFVRMCYAAADATLANSGHEPFGLVGLEVMAAEGIAFTGSTGEDYAISFENAVALETEDPDEIVGYLIYMQQHAEERDKIRQAGKRTASEFTWEEVLDNLAGKIGYLARKQSIVLD